MSEKVTIRVQRFDARKDDKPYFQTYQVDMEPGLTVLGALLKIQREQDGSLAFRSACRAGVCGSCAMHINGKYRLACETQVSRLGRKITIKPLGHLPVVKDLMVDMTDFWRKYRAIRPYLIPGTPAPERERPQSPSQRETLGDLPNCIQCMACYAACTMTALDSEYLGPAALLKVDRFVRDSRDDAIEDRLDIVSGEHGIWRCHTIFNCQIVCPKDLDPSGAIADLKRLAMKRGRTRRIA